MVPITLASRVISLLTKRSQLRHHLVLGLAPLSQSGGITASNWNVSANILPGGGPTSRILRISAFSLDFTPMSGSGLMFNLKMFRVSSTPGRYDPVGLEAKSG